MKIRFLVLLVVFILTLSACGSATPTAAAEWQAYTNPEAGFSISYPPTWTSEVLPDQNNGALHGVALKGVEGGVELYWGVGIGGACAPEARQMIKVAQGELQSCYVKNADGTEHWEQITKARPTASFSGRAYTADSSSTSRQLVQQIISTLSFP
jgi:hypothetical protein